MKIFILEDNKERIKWFKEVFSSESNLFFADNVEEAKKILLENSEFDILFLDHDLDQKIFVNSNEQNTGYQLARFLVENKISFMSIIIHSMNIFGSCRMFDVLKKISENVRRVPFPILRYRVWRKSQK
jgi:CheY-like chemotaxis protein